MSVRHPARLRTRLVATIALLLTVAFLAVSVLTTLLLRSFLSRRLDQQLAAAGDRFAASLPPPTADDTQFDRVPGQSAGTLGARIMNGRVVAAAVVATGNEITSPGTAARDQIAHLREHRGPRTIVFTDLGTYRVLVQRSTTGELVTGLPVEPVDDTIVHAIGIEAGVFGAVLFATIAVATLSVRRSFRPLEEMTQTAEEIARLPLSAGQVSLPPRRKVGQRESETGRLAVAWNGMIDHVETSLRRREASEEQLRRFVADASHELRTPVATVRARAEQALREFADGDGEGLVQVLRRIEAETGRMGHLVEDLLILARVDAGQLRPVGTVDLTLVVLEVVDDARLVAGDHEWSLDLPEEPVEVRGDAEALRRVVINLVTNARTHTPPGSTVSVSLVRLAAGVRLEVRDTGPGIAPDILPTVFDRFVHGTTGTRTGSGLGLAIVHAIVTRHGGEVTVRSTPEGTTFRVDLPS